MLFAYFLMAAFGGGIAMMAAIGMAGDDGVFLGFGAYERWVIFSGAAGGAGGLYVSGERLGQPGARGWLRAGPAMLWITFVGALIAGTLCLPLYGTMFGPFMLAMSFVKAPMLAFFWFANLTAVHVLVAAWRHERETIHLPSHAIGNIRAGRLGPV